MDPMSLQDLYDELVGQELVDPVAQPVKPMAIAAAYLDLSKTLTPTETEKRLLFECCLVLATYNFSGLGADAQGKLIALTSGSPGFEWRPKQSNPEPNAETESED